MNFSFSSLINMTISGSLLVGIIYLLLKNNKILARFGTTLILGCSLLVMLRFLLPFEFPFTNSVYINEIWPAIYLFLTRDLFNVKGFAISPWEILFLIWFAVAAFLILRSIIIYFRLTKKIAAYESVTDLTIISIVSNITAAYKCKKVFRIVETEEFLTPMIFGIKNPYIILPKIPLDESEWDYILQHEIVHYRYGHLLYKFICEFLCDIYWWNPFVYLFKRLLNNILEMNVDAKVTSLLPTEGKLEYLQCLLKIAKINALSLRNVSWAVTFSNRDSSLISQRVNVVFEDMTKKKREMLLPIAAILFSYTLFLCSSLFIIVEPYYISPKNVVGTYSFNENTCYFILNEKGTYDFYIGAEYLKTYDVPFDDTNIKIYNSLEEALTDEVN